MITRRKPRAPEAALVEHQLELRRTLLLPGGGAAVTEHLQRQPVGMTRGDPRDLDDPDTVLELGGESGVVVVLDRSYVSLTARGRARRPPRAGPVVR